MRSALSLPSLPSALRAAPARYNRYVFFAGAMSVDNMKHKEAAEQIILIGRHRSLTTHLKDKLHRRGRLVAGRLSV